MSYEPSHRKPPRQERWPNATPGEGWPAYQQGDGGRDRESAGALAGSRNGYGTANGGYSTASNGYGTASNGYGAPSNGYDDPWGGRGSAPNGYDDPWGGGARYSDSGDSSWAAGTGTGSRPTSRRRRNSRTSQPTATTTIGSPYATASWSRFGIVYRPRFGSAA